MNGAAATLHRGIVGAVSVRVVGAVLLCCVLALSGCGGAANSHTSATTSPKPSPVRWIQIGGAPIGLVAYGGHLWAADAKGNRLVRIQPQSGRVTGQISVGRTPLRVVGFQGSLWSTDFDAGTVSQVSPSAPARDHHPGRTPTRGNRRARPRPLDRLPAGG